MVRADYLMTVVIIFFSLTILFIYGGFDAFCDYQHKETFTIKEFQVSMGGFSSPDIINIQTTENITKIIKLREVYNSVTEISEGDIIECNLIPRTKVRGF